jgi:hypothetical protein
LFSAAANNSDADQTAVSPGTSNNSDHAEVLLQRLLRWWNLPILSERWFQLLFPATLIFMCILRAWTGLDGMRFWVHDAFVFLDGAWRVLNGQVPYNDFSTDIGTFMHLLNALGLVLAHGAPRGLAYAQAAMGLVIGVWAYALSYRRLSPIAAVLMTSILVLLTIAPFDVGDHPTMTSPAMVYNRYGFALVALVIIEAVCDRKPAATKISEFLGGLSTGVIVTLLLFIKVSYFLGVGLLLCLLIKSRRQSVWRWTGLITGSIAGFVPFLIYMGWNLLPMWANLRMLAGAKHIVRGWYITEALRASLLPFFLFAFLAFVLLWRHREHIAARRVLVLSIAVAVVGMCFVVANFPGSRLPLDAVAVVIIMDRVAACFFDKPHTETLMHSAVLLWGALFVFNSLFLDGMGVAYGVWGRWSVQSIPGSTFTAPTLAGFSSFDTGYVHFINDGLALAQQYRRPDDTIASLDFSNPFSYAFAIRPAWGGASTGLQFRTNFDDTHKIPPDYLFGHASLLMMPQPEQFSDFTLPGNISRVYGQYIQKHFHLVGETDLWRAYRNNNDRN